MQAENKLSKAMENTYHIPVLLKESVEALDIKPDGVYVDLTFGGAGHSKEIIKRLSPKGRLFAFDQDPEAKENEIKDQRFTLIEENFSYLKKYLRLYGHQSVDGVLADLGVSSHQLDEAQRGFSNRFDAPLDMRMNPRQELSAKDVVNSYSMEELSKILYNYAELKQSRAIASAICTKRESKPILTTTELSQAVSTLLVRGRENKTLAQIYQAIRIEVNGEMKALEAMLLQLPEVVKKTGRIAIISYHSLEDRLVKRFIRDGKFEGEAEKDIFGNSSKPFKKIGNFIEPSPQEVEKNPRSRSAKLRVGEKI